jgi:RNA polymerase sigma-70 factor (ECF subfamily)
VSVDWSAVFRETYEDLVRYLQRQVWDEERAQDLAQEVFVRSLDSAPDNPRAFLFTVAMNLVKDEARTAVRRKKHLVLLKTEAEVEQEQDVEQETALNRDQEREQLRNALEMLSERDRDILLLWDAGLNYEEIAARTGISVGSVGTTLNRARKKLVDAFESREKKHVARR